MISLKLYITSNSDKKYTDKLERVFTGAFFSLYKQREMLTDSKFCKAFQEKYGFTDIQFRSLKSKVLATVNSKATWEEKNLNRALDIKEVLKEKGYENKHTAFKKRNQMIRLFKSPDKEICFGDINILKKLCKECNKPNRDENLIKKYKNDWKKSRNQGFYLMGEGNQKCNRAVDLTHITEGVIKLKITKDHIVTYTFNPKQYPDWIPTFKRIEEEANLKQGEGEVPVSFHSRDNYMTLSFDEEKLNGYGIKEKDRRKDVKKIKKQNLPEAIEKAKINEIYKDYFDLQEETKLLDKDKDTVIAIDQNPYYISYAIIKMFFDEETGEYEYKILKCGYFDLYLLNSKKGYASDSKKANRLTKKRHYELSIIVKKLFGMCQHYRCSAFILEDLDFQPDDANAKEREANRQINNIWCRTYFERFVTRRCNETGTILKKVFPCWTSFIGNIQHDYNDPVNAAIEIARRGALQYKTGCTYPQVTSTDIVTLGTLFGDGVLPKDSDENIDMTTGFWKSVYNSAKDLFDKPKDFSHRWRKRLTDTKHSYVKCSMDSWRSCVRHIQYDNDKANQKLIRSKAFNVNSIDFQ